ncbi:hypothetical protein EYS14_03380 [Alteromonadaceae bacterium M269]|nr:hypothetical protein EYS14_03380 [Alteromonadaceae bacterium M269]
MEELNEAIKTCFGEVIELHSKEGDSTNLTLVFDYTLSSNLYADKPSLKVQTKAPIGFACIEDLPENYLDCTAVINGVRHTITAGPEERASCIWLIFNKEEKRNGEWIRD